MPRALNLRQIEIFKALIEHGTVSRAAEGLPEDAFVFTCMSHHYKLTTP